jgi:FtsP/CotA-like multicopper oxidase with cupredoxin domain
VTDSQPRLGRRAFLGALGGGAVAALLPWRLGGRGGLPSGGATSALAAAEPYRAKLPVPKVLTGPDIRIPIREAALRVLPGRRTQMWTYGGTFPGPTIRRRAGELTKVTFEHRLGKSAGELSVHLHGGHSRSEFDGQPGGLTAAHPFSLYCKIPEDLSARASGNSLLIRPNRKKTYTYDLIEDGAPERAAFQWYHDHRLDHTGRNVWRGLAGMFILDDDLEDALPLPSGEQDLPLMVVDRSFDRHNQLTSPFGLRPPNDGVTGKLVLVNGAYLPHHHVSPQRYRLRLLNASNFRAYNLYLGNGAKLTQIATDSGLMPAPVERDRVLLGPAERAEVVIDFSGAAGRRVELRSGRRSDGKKSLGSKPYVGPLMQFRVGPGPVTDPSSVPSALRPLPTWAAAASNSPDRSWVITVGGGFSPSWLINGKTFNPGRSEAFPMLNTTETWSITNRTAVTHIMHMHHTDWYMLARNGKPPPPWEDCLKETFFISPGETILVAGHFSDFTGKYVIHCHMLDHEDHGLMSQFEVVAPTAGPAADEVARRARGEIPRHRTPPSFGLPDALPPYAGALRFTPRADGERLRNLDVSVDGSVVQTIGADRLGRELRVPLAGSAGVVTVVATTEDGRMIGATRQYR